MTILRRFSDNTVSTLTDAATIAVDMSLGPHFMVTLGGNRTLGNPTNPDSAKEVWVAVRQDGTGGRTLSFGSDWIPSDSTTTVNPAASSVTVIYAISRNFGSGIKWYYTVEHAAEAGSSTTTYHVLGLNEITSISNIEVVVGGLYFDPTKFGSTPTVIFRLAGELSSTDNTGSAQVVLYDMGPGTGSFSPVKRSTLSIPFSSEGNRVKVDQTLTLSSSPGVDSNQIHNTARVYELRMKLVTVDSSSYMIVTWSGLEVTT
jgi:hypothetical protein